MSGGENSRKPVFGFRLLGKRNFAKVSKCLGGNLGDFGEFCKGLILPFSRFIGVGGCLASCSVVALANQACHMISCIWSGIVCLLELTSQLVK